MKTPDDDRSCSLLTEALASGEHFHHVKFGDGAIRVMHGEFKGEASADGDPMWGDFDAAAEHFAWIWNTIRNSSHLQTIYMADWNTCSDPEGLEDRWAAMMASGDFLPVAYEALLLHRLTPALREFYITVRHLPVRKVILTSWQNNRAADILQAMPVYIPGPREYGMQRSDAIGKRAAQIIADANPLPNIVFLAGGSVAAAAQAHLIEWRTPVTTIALGSALDPLCHMARTRSGQVQECLAKEYFRALL